MHVYSVPQIILVSLCAGAADTGASRSITLAYPCTHSDAGDRSLHLHDQRGRKRVVPDLATSLGRLAATIISAGSQERLPQGSHADLCLG